MTDAQRAVQRHYGQSGLYERILEALRAMGKDLLRLSPEDLSPVDQFHTMGRIVTAQMAQSLALTGNEHILDIGSGLGGPARFLARTYNCRVSGLELTQEFCEVAERLAALVGMEGRVTYRQGDATAMPFPDASFDIAWSQNSVMNIADRQRLYEEIRRVLKPGGRYIFSDVMAGPGGAPFYPQPWASEPSISFLLTPQETRTAMETAGFQIVSWDDSTAQAVQAAQERVQAADRPPPLGVHLLVRDHWGTVARNSLKNYQEQRLLLIQGLAQRES